MTNEHHNKPILLVEDDLIDQLTVKRALKELAINNTLLLAENGEEALDLLEGTEELELPYLILLDINMPRMSGIELLEIIKQKDRYKSIPVIILTTSKDEQDLKRSYEHSIAGYMLKPIKYKDYMDLIKVIYTYWTKSLVISN